MSSSLGSKLTCVLTFSYAPWEKLRTFMFYLQNGSHTSSRDSRKWDAVKSRPWEVLHLVVWRVTSACLWCSQGAHGQEEMDG